MTLTQLFTAIANAIRAKTGSSDSIVAEDFPDEISTIETGKLTQEEYNTADDDLDDILENTVVPSGTISITQNGTTDVTNYVQANVNVDTSFNATKTWQDLGYSTPPDNSLDTYSDSFDILNNWDNTITNLQNYFKDYTTIKYFPLIDTHNVTNMYSTFWNDTNLISIPLLDTSNVTTMRGMFFICNALKVVPLLDTSNVTTMRNMFYECNVLEQVPLFDTSNVEDMASMFFNCKKIYTAPQFNTSKVVDMSNMFNGCLSLHNVPIFNTTSVTDFSSMFTYCTWLTNDSLNNIMKMCINATAYTGTKTLAQLGLTSSQASTCQSLSNYQDFLNAGWTIGF